MRPLERGDEASSASSRPRARRSFHGRSLAGPRSSRRAARRRPGRYRLEIGFDDLKAADGSQCKVESEFGVVSQAKK
jgi:hypothetical protein